MVCRLVPFNMITSRSHRLIAQTDKQNNVKGNQQKQSQLLKMLELTKSWSSWKSRSEVEPCKPRSELRKRSQTQVTGAGMLILPSTLPTLTLHYTTQPPRIPARDTLPPPLTLHLHNTALNIPTLNVTIYGLNTKPLILPYHT